MPSLQHRVLARLIPRLRGANLPVDDIPGMRRRLTEQNRLVVDGPPRDVRRHHAQQLGTVHGFPVFTLWSTDRQSGGQADVPPPRRTLFYVHGGAYIRPTASWHWRFATRLGRAIGARVVMPIYPLAPEFTVEDSFEAMLELLEEAAADSPDGVVLAGDSSGGGYALALAEAVRDRGRTPATHLLLLAPWVDLTGDAPGTDEAAARDPWLSRPHMPVYASFWAGSEDREALLDPRVSPGLGDLRDLPPALVFCGTRDLLQPGCDALFERAEEHDWALEYVVAPGLIHVYPLLPIPEARSAFSHIVEFLG
jgi:monoterpene epsilon-lactone hydrolase